MDIHIRRLSICAICCGVLFTLTAVIALISFGGVSGVYYAADDAGFGFLASASLSLYLFTGVPLAIAGYFVGRYREWARYATIVLCAINVLNFPIGSLLGAYGLWVLLSPETDPLFRFPRPFSKPVPPSRVVRKQESEKRRVPPQAIKTVEPHLPE